MSCSLPIWLQFVVEGVKLLVSALLSAWVAVRVVNRLKTRSDYVEKRVDDVCSEIRSIANLASDYWTKPPANELLVVEAKIQAGVRLIEELRVATSRMAPELVADGAVSASSDFFRAATGGQFGVHNRLPELDRAVEVQHAATRYVGAVRRARLTLS